MNFESNDYMIKLIWALGTHFFFSNFFEIAERANGINHHRHLKDMFFFGKNTLNAKATKKCSWKKESVLASNTYTQPARQLPSKSLSVLIFFVIDSLHLNISK